MHLRSPNGELSLHLLHAVAGQSSAEPDLQIRVDARVGPFAATNAGAWLEWPDVNAFINELAALAAVCKGSATIGAMSPTDLTLSVSNADDLGHFILKFSIGSLVHSRAGIVPCSLSGGFELELSQVEEMAAWFKAAGAGK